MGDRQLALSPPAGGTNISLAALTTLAVSAQPGATEVSLVRGAEVLATTGGDAEMLELDPGRVGRGPFRVHAQARYPDGGVVASASIWLQGVRPKPPELTAIRITTGDDGAVRLDPEWGEVPTAGTTWTWYQASEGLKSAAPPELLGMGMLTRTNGSYALVPDRQQGEQVLALPALMARHRIRPTEIAARIRLLPGASAPAPHRLGGLAFNVRGQKSFDVFGYHLTRNAWVLGRWEDGGWSFASRRGRPFPRGRPVELRVREEAGRIRGMVDGETVCSWPDGGFDKGRPWGIISTALEVRFQDLWVSPPILDGAGWREHDGSGQMRRPARATGARLVLRADNGFTSRVQRTELSEEPPAP